MWFSRHKEVSSRLAPSEDSLQLLIDTTPALIHTALPDGSLDFFNRRWLEYVGLPLSEVLGWGWTSAIHREDVEEFVERWRASVESGEPFEVESRVRRADGEYRWFLHRKVALRNEAGTIVKWYGSSIEIEDRKRAEQKIRQDEMELRQLIDFLPHMVFVLDPNGDFIHANQKVFDYTGFTPQQMREVGGERLVEWGTHPDDAEKVRNECQRGIANGTPFEIERRIISKDGSYRWFLIRYNPLVDETGHIVRWFGSTTDIEERKQAEEGIRKENIALREEIAKTSMFEEIVGTSPALQAVLTLVAKV